MTNLAIKIGQMIVGNARNTVLVQWITPNVISVSVICELVVNITRLIKEANFK